MEIKTTNFTYCDINFNVCYDPSDTSCLGAIREIVDRDEYKLSLFRNQVNKTFIDIGANAGIATIIMAKLNPKSKVYAFEPFQKTYRLLLKNISLNRLTNVVPSRLAVSKPGINELTLSVWDDCSGANSVIADTKLFNEKYEQTSNTIVKCISFDKILEKFSINEVFLLKIDCEGAEFDIIYPSNKFKHKIVKNMVGEFHDLNYNNTKNGESRQLLDYCEKYVDGIIQISILLIE